MILTKPNILVVFGTRPEAIKMVPVLKEFEQHSDKFATTVCLTSQHGRLLRQVIERFQVQSDYDLDVMEPAQTLDELTAKILVSVSKVIDEVNPSLVVVHGDTTTTLASALAAYYKKRPVAHVEAGLRTKDIYSPWPEEVNRKFVASVAALNFAPTENARSALMAEGVSSESIHVTGNTVIDALFATMRQIENTPSLKQDVLNSLSHIDFDRRLVLVTGHRRENHGEGINALCKSLKEIAAEPDVTVIFPVHPNPAVREIVYQKLSNTEHVHLIEPLEYMPFVYLMANSTLIITDSGGIQEEAPSFGVPVLVTRSHTERQEAIEAGVARLVGGDCARLSAAAKRLLSDQDSYLRMSARENPFGDGRASVRIADSIVSFLSTMTT